MVRRNLPTKFFGVDFGEGPQTFGQLRTVSRGRMWDRIQNWEARPPVVFFKGNRESQNARVNGCKSSYKPQKTYGYRVKLA